MTSGIKAVLLDAGGVLIKSPMQLWPEMEEKLHLSKESIQKTILSSDIVERFHELERGDLTLEDFDAIFTHFYNKQNGRTDKSILRVLSFTDNHAKVDLRWIRILRALRDEGFRVYVLTNNWYIDRARCHRTSYIDISLVDGVFESCRLKMRKPEERIYKHVTQSLKVLFRTIYIHIPFSLIRIK
jgi:epoxide hydrolase-like predicted phosphatase